MQANTTVAVACSAFTALWLIGCGGGAPAPKPVAVPGPAPVQQAGAGKASPVQAQPQVKKDATKKAAAPRELFPGESPSDIFVAASTAEPMATEKAPAHRPEDHLQVQGGIAGSNANQLAVAVLASPTSFTPRDDFKLPSGFTALKNYGYAEDGLPRRIKCDKDNSIMALVSGGVALVGTDSETPTSSPQWSVFLDPYYMDLTEVTIADYKRFQDEQREQKKKVPLPPVNESAGGQFPALGITWGDARAYVLQLGKDLPTEVEFEKAARGPDGFKTPWGNGREVWANPRTPATVAPAGAFVGDQSVYGIFDLAGNAREWTGDWYDPKAYEDAASQAASKPLRNWTGPKKTDKLTQRVVKGSTADWAAWNRAGSDMGARVPDIGFRGVLRTPLSATETTPATKTTKKAAL
jgi:sulfatase modifying factor 1